MGGTAAWRSFRVASGAKEASWRSTTRRSNTWQPTLPSAIISSMTKPFILT